MDGPARRWMGRGRIGSGGHKDSQNRAADIHLVPWAHRAELPDAMGKLAAHSQMEHVKLSSTTANRQFSPSSSITIDELENCRFYFAGLRLRYQDFANRYELCLSHLQDALYEADVLRLKNERFRISNGVLKEWLVMGQDLDTTAGELQKLRIESSLLSATAVPHPPPSRPPSEI